MHTPSILAATCIACCNATAGAPAHATTAGPGDHREFEATLAAPFHADSEGWRVLTLRFSYPDSGHAHRIAWRLDLLPQDGAGAAPAAWPHWQGRLTLNGAPRVVTLRWRAGVADGTVAGTAAATGAAAAAGKLEGLADGLYQLRLRAGPARSHGPANSDNAYTIEQRWPVAVGAWTAAAPLAMPAWAPLPYTIYYGNLHSQTGHSDGGGPLADCHGAQAPQSAVAGPAQAYAYAQAHGLDFLMTSEHNHLYDGSDATNAAADPAAAKALYHSGLKLAAGYSVQHPGFVALYGQEWGVISHGGHLNIFNSARLLGWERNGAGRLLADIATAKGDYAGLYALMRKHGWTGQFNHPQPGQFAAAGQAMAYTPDGDQVMLLCEVMNSSAFSNRDDEGEAHASNYEAACGQLLEAGFHVAFSSNQDNHCANWGASAANRTGVLLPAGAPLDRPALLAALQARRVFATMDKTAQLILSGNGHLMGERFSNSGPLALSVRYASSSGRSVAALSIIEGVPGRHGQVALLSNSAETLFTPAPGAHFYYARLTQDDGKLLWSAPLWVDQQSAP